MGHELFRTLMGVYNPNPVPISLALYGLAISALLLFAVSGSNGSLEQQLENRKIYQDSYKVEHKQLPCRQSSPIEGLVLSVPELNN